MLGFGLLIEAATVTTSAGLLPESSAIRIVAGLAFGVVIGLISSLLGVAGGEVIIPTLVFGYGIPIKVAGPLSLMISFPTVLAGLLRHRKSGILREPNVFTGLILPMGAGAAFGAFIGGLLVGIAPAAALKVALGILLVWSAWKIWTSKHHGSPTS